MHTREQVYKETLKYFAGDELAANVWIDKYCLKKNGDYLELTPDDMHRRLAKEFARIEQKYPNPMTEDEIYDLLKDFKYIVPQGSPMAGIGNNFTVSSISNCFVVHNEHDSYSAIMRTDEEQAHLMRRRGGVGSDISHLRPSGALAAGVPLGDDAGATLYMDRLSHTTREVQQDGRRGAKMISISSLHPDVEKFIDKKLVKGAVTGANISVRMYDEVMEAALNDRDIILRFPVETKVSPPDELKYGKLTHHKDAYFKRIKGKVLLDKLVYNAWKSAEPGCLFWDKILSESPARGYGAEWKERSTNPLAT